MKFCCKWVLLIACAFSAQPVCCDDTGVIRSIDWEKNYLFIRGTFPGDEVRIHYLEAYCRPGSTDRDWEETVIPHSAEQLAPLDNSREIRLRDTLADGIVVEHVIHAGTDDVTFDLTATNPTGK